MLTYRVVAFLLTPHIRVVVTATLPEKPTIAKVVQVVLYIALASIVSSSKVNQGKPEPTRKRLGAIDPRLVRGRLGNRATHRQWRQ